MRGLKRPLRVEQMNTRRRVTVTLMTNRGAGPPLPSRAEQLQQTVYASDPHTAVKQALYRRYTQCWMGKLLRSFPECAIVDAFCAAGEYSDGLDGSPLTFAKTFLSHSARPSFHRLHLVCADQRPDRLAHLNTLRSTLELDPRLEFEVTEPELFVNARDDLDRRAHRSGSQLPVLWVLDPYDWESIPFELVARCLNARRDEVIVTLFTEELHRFCSDPNKAPAISRYLGTEEWTHLRSIRDQAERKVAFSEMYMSRLREMGVHAGRFGVAKRAHMPRYDLVFATHDPAGMECWNGATWYLDRFAGGNASLEVAAAPTLFDEQPMTDPLVQELENYVGSELGFARLRELALAKGYKETHLRAALTTLRSRGQAIRVDGVSTRTEWPEASVVRFYAETDVAPG